jgi:hypothetical protein
MNSLSSRSSNAGSSESKWSQRKDDGQPLPHPLLTSGSSMRSSPGRSAGEESPPTRTARSVRHPSPRHPADSAEIIPLRSIQYPITDNDSTTIHSGLLTQTRLLEMSSDQAGIVSIHGNSKESNAHQSLSVQTTGSSSTMFVTSRTTGAKYYDETATVASSSTAVEPFSTRVGPVSYRPVDAIAVFHRYAAPLFLPELDEYLASIPSPEFAKWKGKGKEKSVPIFPPMDRLVAEKKSLDDLKYNSSIVPVWKSRNVCFSVIYSAFVGIAVSFTLRLLCYDLPAKPSYRDPASSHRSIVCVDWWILSKYLPSLSTPSVRFSQGLVLRNLTISPTIQFHIKGVRFPINGVGYFLARCSFVLPFKYFIV